VRRRTFLEFGAIGCGAGGLGAADTASRPLGPCLTFYVAGVRYVRQPEGDGLPRFFEEVQLAREHWQGEYAYAVVLASGSKLGYVPKALIPALEGRPALDGFVASAYPYAAPWKRFRVTVRLD
jgi:hypothetical protein